MSSLILCVPTPLNAYREPDFGYILRTLETLLPHFQRDQILVLESTTYPGTTEEQLVPRIEGAGFVVGEGFYVAYSPEREDPGNPSFSTRTIPKVIGGNTKACLEIAVALYQQELNNWSRCLHAELLKCQNSSRIFTVL